ncbi:MAG TPA: DNA polymerase III subunit beta [Pyrinomonadaceae bacterium]|nr:DNA polymerase III subunit beta [Pyrinomonadaceae bacterium]
MSRICYSFGVAGIVSGIKLEFPNQNFTPNAIIPAKIKTEAAGNKRVSTNINPFNKTEKNQQNQQIMEFIINPSLLKEELGLLTPVIERKATIPVLSKIKMETNIQGELALTATDLDVTMRVNQVTDVLQSGSILVEGRKLYEISRELPNEPIHFALNKNGQIEIRYKKGRHKLSTVESSQFPEVPMNKQPGVRVPTVLLREAIRRTVFAVTTEQGRFTIHGAKLVVDEQSLILVATDGHRLAYTRFPLVNSSGQQLDLLIPKKLLLQLEDLLDRELKRDAESLIEIGETANQLCFMVGRHTLFSRKLTGTFPNWEMALPKNLAFTAEISTEDFRQSLSRVTLTSETKNYSITMEIQSGKLVLKSSTAEGEAQEEMLAVLNGGNSQNVHALRFNSRYMQDFLQVIAKAGSPTFTLSFNDSNSPFELALPNECESFRYVLMPLRGE